MRPEDLIYTGKRVLLWPSRDEATALSVAGTRLLLGSARPLSGTQLMVNFLGQRYRAAATVDRVDHETWSAEVEESFEEFNLRGNPRVKVSIPATYYLRPPTHGVPVQVVDLSLGGLAISPPHGYPSLGETTLISFQVGSRMVKLLAEVVACEASCWRMRVTRITSGDEDAIAAWLLALQVGGRRLLPPIELDRQSTMDLESRLRFPLITKAILDGKRFTFGTGSQEISFATDHLRKDELEKLRALAVNLRLASPADANHLLRAGGVGPKARDRFIASYIALAASASGTSQAGVIASGLDLPLAVTPSHAPSDRDAAGGRPGYRLQGGLVIDPEGTVLNPGCSTSLAVAFQAGDHAAIETDLVGLIEFLATDNGAYRRAIAPTRDGQYLGSEARATVECLADLFANVATIDQPN